MKIIAEVSSNWHTLEDCLRSIELAREANAHAVKFQLFTGYELFGPTVDIKTFADIGKTPYMDRDWIPVLSAHAKRHEIEFMCTAFSVSGYEYIDPFVQTHKIASAEMTDINILEAVNSFNKPVYISTAGSTIEEINAAVNMLHDCPVTIMFCVGDYPAKVIDFRKLDQLKAYFGANYSYGYSDHSIDVMNIPLIAKARGCTVIEKHVNFTMHKDTNDALHSLSFSEFMLMNRAIMDEWISTDEVELHANDMMKRLYRRKLIVTRDIKAGEKFKYNDNVYIYRPQKVVHDAISPFQLSDMEGKVSSRDKFVGEVVTYDDIEVEV